MNRPLRIAIVGTGFLAKTRQRCWARVHGGETDVVVAARKRGGASLTIDEALADPGITLVDICVPNAAHREIAERAAAAGKHVLCTKPLTAFCGQGLAADATAAAVAATPRLAMLARAVAEAQAMIDACARASVRLFYGENWLHAPAVRRAAELGAAAKGVVLEMRGWESHSGSHSPYARDWRATGGGALLRLGAHPIGAMVWWKQQEGLRRRGKPTLVTAVTGEVADVGVAATTAGAPSDVATGWNGVENWGSVVLHFDDGSRGIAHGSDTMLGGMQSHLTILASDHRCECSLSPQDALRAYAVRDGTFGSEYVMEKVHGQAGWSTPMPDEDVSSGQQELVQAVADELRGGPAAAGDGALGLEVVRIVYAAYASAAEGRRVAIAR